MKASDNVITSNNMGIDANAATGAKDTSVNIESIEGNVYSGSAQSLPAASISYLETLKTLLVAVSICGTIGLAWKYEAALTPALVVLGSAVGGYFGASTPNGIKR